MALFYFWSAFILSLIVKLNLFSFWLHTVKRLISSELHNYGIFFSTSTGEFPLVRTGICSAKKFSQSSLLACVGVPLRYVGKNVALLIRE